MKENTKADKASIWDWLPGVLFGLPFAAFGSFAVWKGYSNYSKFYNFDEETIGLLGVGSLFCLIGYGIILGSLKARARLARERALKAKYPNEPWMHRPEWVSRSIPCESKSGVLGAWILAILWNGVSCAPLFAIAEELEKGNRAILVALIFPLVGLYIIYGAIRTTFQWYKYGNTKLRLGTATGTLGGDVRGTLFGDQNLPTTAVFELTLQNINKRVVGSGKHRRTVLDVLYEQKKSIPASKANLRSGIPIQFAIPYDTRVSDYSKNDNSMLWKVTVSSQVPGVDYEASFEIPVFDTGKGDKSLVTETISEREVSSQAHQPDFPISPGVTFETGTSERKITFHSLREKGKAFNQALVFFVIAGLIWALSGEVPTPALAFFAFFNVFVLYALCRSLFHARQVVIRPTEIIVMERFLGIGQEKNYSRDEIAEIKTLMQAHTQSDPRYVAILMLKNSDKVEITEAVRDSREAEWFAEQMSASS